MKTDTCLQDASQVKYAGAEWLFIQRGTMLSPLAIKVANVLGQVYKGIYHLFEGGTSLGQVDWDASIIKVRVFDHLATFDADRLTVLVLCCRSAGLEFSVTSKGFGYLNLSFREATIKAKNPAFINASEHMSIDDFIDHLGFVRGKSRWLNERLRRGQEYVCLSLPNTSSIDIPLMVADAHQACIRAEIRALGNRSMELWLSKRIRTGHFFEMHPSWLAHQSKLSPVCSIDFSVLQSVAEVVR